MKPGKTLLWAALACLVLGLVIWIFWQPVWTFLQLAWEFLSDKERLRHFIESYGIWAPLVFMGLQTAQVFIAPIPGEFTGLVGGYVFGWPWGLLYSTIALSLGSIINFFIGRLLGRRLVERWLPAHVLEKMDALMKRQGIITGFILFIIPGFPKDYLCLALGLTPLNWRIFFLICTIGRIPGTLMLSLQGAMVYQENYWSLLWISLLAMVFLLPVYIWREKIYQWTLKLDKPKGEKAKLKSPLMNIDGR